MELTDYIKKNKVEKVYLYENHRARIEGTLVLTSYHIIFSEQLPPPDSDTGASPKHQQQPSTELMILHRIVDVVERRASSTQLHLKLKDLRHLKFDIPGIDNCAAVAESIHALKKITGESVPNCYPFFYRPNFKNHPRTPHREVPVLPKHGKWRVSDINKNFEICATYPTTIIVPMETTDDEIAMSSAFREGGRFPILSYSSPTTGAVLMRSGQPLVGPMNRRCKADETLLSHVICGSKKGLIMDMRSLKQCEAARVKGGGIEPETHYSLWKKIHKPIEFGPDCYNKFIEACCDETISVDKWLSRVESSGWLTAVTDVMQHACVTAQCLHVDGISVLLHGSTGMNSTLAVSSLTQVILEPNMRTIVGFEELIEREWLSAGHKFQSRYEWGPFSSKGKDNAPTFILFLDCVYQLMQQFPWCFEFKQDFLMLLITNVYASSLGTFLGDSPKDRALHRVNELTCSLWTYIEHEEKESLLNPLYDRLDEVIWPSVAPQSIVVWSSFYLRKTYDDSSEKLADEIIKEIVEKDRAATQRVIKLREEVARLEAIKEMKLLSINGQN